MINFREKIQEALIWSQKYTQTDMIYVAKGGFWLALGEIISAVASFLLAITFANLLPKETYGEYQYILSISSILIIFTLPGMNWAVSQAVARGYEGSFLPGFNMKIRWGMLTGFFSLGFAGYYFLKEDFALSASFLIAAFFLSLTESPAIFHGYLEGKKLFSFLTKYVSLIQLILVGCLIIILFLTKNLISIILTYFISFTVLRLLFLKVVLKKFPPNRKEDPNTLSYGKHLSVMEAANLIAAKLDYILLWHFLGAGALAVYSFAFIIPYKISGLCSGIIRPLSLPKLSEKNSEDLKASLPKKAFKLFLILIPFVVLYIILAPVLYKIFFPRYLDSVFYSRILAVSILFIPETIFSTSLIAKMKKQYLYVFKFLSPLIRIVFLLIFTPLYGIIGVVSAVLIAQASTLGLSIFLFKRM